METLNIPLGVEVECADGFCGRSTHIIFDPIRRKASYFVVQNRDFSQPDSRFDQRLVPIDKITDTTSDRICLNCTKSDLEKLPVFTDRQFLKSEQFELTQPNPDRHLLLPHVISESVSEDVCEDFSVEEIVSQGALAIRRGETVEATDGAIGSVEELLIHPSTDQVTHIVVRRGRLWNRKELTLPISAIDRVDQDTVHLKLDTNAVDLLPTLPITRVYQLPKHEIGAVGMAIAVFEGMNTANEVLASLKLLNHLKIEVLGIAVLENHGDEKIEVKATEVDSDTVMSSVIGATLGAVLGSILGPVTAVLGAASGGAIGAMSSPSPATDLIEKLLAEQDYALAVNHSALVVLVEEKWLDQAVVILNNYTDRVRQQIITGDTVNQLLNPSDS
jgi:uncharacterized membrane protein